ncbi:PIN domain-containing protein [Desulfoscipio sp. XC116]|uniref:PIN domain-containing protein n=1 Tax=Desulfoscipio sp. XC116 TaxID=3144975 RepID=UPI00325A8BF5
MQNERITVFLDTNIFLKASYNFQNGKLATIRRYCDEGFIDLVVSSVVCREVETHIKKDLEECYGKIKHLLSERRLVALRSEPDFSRFLAFLSTETMVEKVLSQFSDFLEDTHCTIIGTGAVQVENVLSDLFAMRPPFETKKQDEFKDSIILYSLRDYQRALSIPIWAVSDDTGFRKALEGDINFLLFTSTEDMLNKVNAKVKADQYIKIKEYINEQNGMRYIVNRLEEVLFDAAVSPDIDLFDDAQVIAVDSIKYRLDTIDEIDNEMAVVSMEAECNINISYTFFDEENSVYDTIDHEYAYQHIGEVNEEHLVRFPFCILLSLFDDTIDIDKIDVEDGRLLLSLDEETLIKSERVDDISFNGPDEEWIGYMTCPTCGCQITFKNDGGNVFCSKCVQD